MAVLSIAYVTAASTILESLLWVIVCNMLITEQIVLVKNLEMNRFIGIVGAFNFLLYLLFAIILTYAVHQEKHKSLRRYLQFLPVLTAVNFAVAAWSLLATNADVPFVACLTIRSLAYMVICVPVFIKYRKLKTAGNQPAQVQVIAGVLAYAVTQA